MLDDVFTIYSDDEIDIEPSEDEDECDNQSGTQSNPVHKPTRTKTHGKLKKKEEKKRLFSFDFDDGENITGKRPRPDDDENDDFDGGDDDADADADAAETVGGGEELNPGELDNVRTMPRAEERAARAADKKRKQTQQNTQSNGVNKKSNRKDNRDDDDDDNNDDDDEAAEAAAEAEAEAAYFDAVLERPEGSMQFSQLNLSRPLLRAVEAAGYVTPTPVQAAVIPLAMAGRDICASAVTGSGKTAAFVLPFLERLLFRPKDVSAIRVLVVTPTRELATQIFSVLQTLARFTDMTCCLICGGKKDVRSQEAVLRSRPDVAVCTPGRLIDHLRNSQSVSLDDLDVLVLDEADRLLDMGFQAEVEELLRHCPANRQTMLFSATMTPKVDDLAKLSLRRPVRVKTSGGAGTVAPRLVQEFVKVRAHGGRDGRDDEREREAMVAALVCRSFQRRTIVFCETKKEARRLSAVLTALSVRACELHGDVSQALRYQALQQFRNGEADVMVCTDVAARGLDIPGVQTVVNAEMPRTVSTYVHRVGRTARAGCGGRAVTLVGDARRKVMKEVLKGGQGGTGEGDGAKEGRDEEAEAEARRLGLGAGGPGQVLSRTIPGTVVAQFVAKIAALEETIAEALAHEQVRAKMDEAEREAERAENLLLHEEEIAARPARTWHQTETQKAELREASRVQVRMEEEQARFGADAAGAQRARTAAEKAAAMARADDYRSEGPVKGKVGKDVDKDGHRLSRKKRRRLEAMAGMEGEGHGRDSGAIAAAPRQAKRASKEEKAQRQDKSLGELNPGKKLKFTNGSSKVLRPKFAVGGLDSDAVDWGGSSGGGESKKHLRRKEKELEFKEYDPDKRLRKGGKVGHKAFKSKSKFKRKK